ncbi:hypothetical protein A5672_00285 [Mycobacterium alsense]|uniref:Transmembrane protein n=1 Tax=Mycobacterium alsense TaxID=324058 RepID=A0ABD6NY35_9MYCO|nr:phage holin family protein [Mycobacterium alsense]OBG30663.1 hypothetical protein A5672_00285 [Mycobacterium alsense]OBJ04863.1 hypothetical protein A5660_17815 [Mycobacterium alsense]
MLIIALVLALIGLIALVFAVVTSNELVAWVCIAASVLGVVLLIIDALRERQRRDAGAAADDSEEADEAEDEAGDAALDYPEEVPDEGERPGAESGEPGVTSEDEPAVDDRAK